MHRRDSFKAGTLVGLLTLLAIGFGGNRVSLAGSFEVSNWRELVDTYSRLNAAQFLSRATFGPTEAEVDKLAKEIREKGRRRALSKWIDKQFEKPVSHHHDLIGQMLQTDGFSATDTGINHTRYRHHAWWHRAITAEDQLRQRMAWALAQIVVVGQNTGVFNQLNLDATGQPRWLGITDYYDMLVDNAFGDYGTLLEDVTFHPIMGVYLSHVRNPKANPAIGRYPDENYAREVLQLFSIGLYMQKSNGQFRRDRNGQLIPTYDNETIKAFARIFTGLSYARAPNFWRAPINFHEPMIMFDNMHDPGPKTLLRGKVVESPGNGEAEIRQALDNIASHPNVPPFIARALIQRFVKSNPSKGYIWRVARAFRNNGHGKRGDFKAVIKAVLLDREALSSQYYRFRRKPLRIVVRTRGTEYSRLREPVLRYTAMIRALRPTTDYANGYFMLPSQESNMNQGPYLSHHVFNFYSPDYQPPGDITNYTPSRRIPNGDLYAPEFEILTSVIANRFANRLRSDLNDATANFTILWRGGVNPLKCNVSFDLGPETDLAADPAALLQHLDLLLCHGTMSDKTRAIIADVISQVTADPLWRAKGAVLSVLTSPECACDE